MSTDERSDGSDTANSRSRTVGEACFEEYLRDAGIAWAYEVQTGGKTPDYVVRCGGSEVVCEVKDIERGDIEARVEAARGTLIGVDNYPRLRKKITRAAAQFRYYKGTLPCVIVLFKAGARVPLSTTKVAAMMFGDLAFKVRLRDPSGVRAVFGDRGKLRRNQHTTVSAVAVVERFKPDLRAFDRLVEERLPKSPKRPTFDDVQTAKQAVANEHPELNPAAVATRVRVVHNPFAAISLPDGIFAGAHDKHWNPTFE